MKEVNDIKVTVENGIKELVIRTGEAELNLSYHGYGIDGLSIDAVNEYLIKADATDLEIKNSFVLFSYENLFLRLRFSDRMRAGNTVREGDRIDGELKLHPELEKWQINKAKAYSNHSLASFVKMNRHFFEDRDLALTLVTVLQGIQVKTEKEIESADNKRGDYRQVIGQRVIDSNIPDSFMLKLPVFVGTAPVPVKVEIEINPSDFSCTLISPQLKEIIDLESRAIIDQQLNAIREMYPQLRIFQK